MEETFRWFGPADPVRLNEIRQTGARGIVTALHDIPYGEVWPLEAIMERRRLIEADRSLGLRWSVVESLPVHENIKLGEGDLRPLFDNYRTSLRNLAAAGVTTVCYNFMPLLDWMRTDLAYPQPGGALALRFDAHLHAAFDCFMLERPGAAAEFSPEVLARARAWFDASTEADRQRLLDTIMAGLPGAYTRYDVPGLKAVLARYDGFGVADLRANLKRFLEEVVPTAEEAGVRLCVHPDDPPRPLFGLPRIVSNAEDLAYIVAAAPSPANGITLCTGSLGARADNDLPTIARRFAAHIHFAHLRNVKRDADSSFMESEHLDGDVDMVAVIVALHAEEQRRAREGRADRQIPMRPDHGQVLLDDGSRKTHPGYPLVGRLRGLAELRGVMKAVAALT
ncbi:D-mannonate dehydratase [Chelatococcus sambhunathii]|uniref:Mannonate dehydratase n=2 Tax=Chelatococcus TaxID=28209 RepID=A0AAC9NYK6_9HYPH|nr:MULTISPECIES: mannonate dehydratase [Chelatococcus]APF37253.1 mannonate dehydratase [Chelatococcus daeguensis]CUA90041.1 D-mannonate dehydratase [Chelatococcus sambhunathii]